MMTGFDESLTLKIYNNGSIRFNHFVDKLNMLGMKVGDILETKMHPVHMKIEVVKL